MKNSLKTLLTGVTCAVFLTCATMRANAIENGKPDSAYENVGVLGVYLGGAGPFGLCSGFVISDRAFVTAAHCLTAIPALQHVPEAWAVTLTSGSPKKPIVPPGIFASLGDIFKFPISVKTYSPMRIHSHPDFDSATNENDVAVLVFPVGTFDVQPVKLARPGFLKRLKRLRILKKLPIGVVGYGAVGPARNDAGDIIGLRIPGHRNRGFSALQKLSRTRLFLGTTPVLDSMLLSGDSGSPQFALGRAVSLSSVTGFGEQRLDTHAVRWFLSPFISY